MAKKPECCFQRYEKKYMLTRGQYAALLRGLEPYTKPDEYGQYAICSLYYDTDDFRLIRASLEKPLYKEKLRLRSYGVPGEDDKVFVELKKKFDGVVYKRRVMMEAAQACAYLGGSAECPEDSQIGREIDWFQRVNQTKPKVFIAYDRAALAGREDPRLRFTFDTNLRWRDTDLDLRLGDHGAPLLPPDRVLMEVKLPGAAPLWLSRLLGENKIYPTSFSKYGTCYRENLMDLPSNKKEARFCA